MTGVQMQEVRDALRDASDLVALDQMLRFRLNIVRRNIVADGPLNNVAFQLLDVAQMEGWETDLVEAAYRERPRNLEIREVYQKYGRALRGEFPVRPTELERIIRESHAMLNMAEWCERAAKIQDGVCRIELQGNPTGKGFLVGRGRAH